MTTRWMIRKDLPDVVRIEQLSFDRPWTEAEFINACRSVFIVPRVAQRDNEIVGYMLYELNSRNYKVVNLAVDPKYRREGIGGELMRWLTGRLSGKRTEVIAEPSERNLPAHLFFRSLGFKGKSVIRDPWNTGEDAYLMAYRQPSGVGA